MELPDEPLKPLDTDCCGQGCTPCVFDIYDEELKIWLKECERISNGNHKQQVLDKQQDTGPLLSSTEYKTFKIEQITKESKDSFRYRFSLPQGYPLGLAVGQHIIIRAHINGETVTRQYTPVSDVFVTSYFELIIKIYNSGKMSQFVRDWAIGTEVEMRGPCGHLEYRPNKYRRIFMLCVGTGIAPMCQVIHHILNNELDETFIELHYGCRTYEDILLKSELDEWGRFWNFSVTYYLSQDTSQTKYRYGDKVKHCRIEMETLQAIMTDLSDEYVLICGTRSFEKSMIDALKNLGFSTDNYHKF